MEKSYNIFYSKYCPSEALTFSHQEIYEFHPKQITPKTKLSNFGCILGRSRSTVVNSYDLTTCPSWVQAPNRPCRHTCRIDYPAMGGNQLVTESQRPLVVQAGLDRQRLLSQRRRRSPMICVYDLLLTHVLVPLLCPLIDLFLYHLSYLPCTVWCVIYFLFQ